MTQYVYLEDSYETNLCIKLTDSNFCMQFIN